MEERLIAPCGMNCGICMAFLREENGCPGCRAGDTNKAITVISCRIKNCETLQEDREEYCSGCDSLPCKSLKNLDKRYRTKYKMSMVENLRQIKEDDMEAFLAGQRAKYRCPRCGGVVCVHNGPCHDCERSRS